MYVRRSEDVMSSKRPIYVTFLGAKEEKIKHTKKITISKRSVWRNKQLDIPLYLYGIIDTRKTIENKDNECKKSSCQKTMYS